ncbi:MAG: 2-succinyl-5-enolpyruvyl-6-hydroxy-3-cyclohexene-1-carboxylic-acid synthase [Actinomycetaceae bacterium]|nr:2-succinyl-5-enolpyruvyl-6-hydroxy-3-cyclohexene-1-carboxylic-acid synthase [Actinomycetaceae bacterium]
MSELPVAISTAREIVATLAAYGVGDVVYSPGSRDAPFAYALARAQEQGLVRVHVRIDERSAAFFALGLSRAAEVDGQPARPVAIVTTSGTALAHTHPALLEAAHACVPLVVISADRPDDMRGTGANQTTEHTHILAGTVRGTWDVAPGGDAGSATAQALAWTRGGDVPAGPVHLNVQLSGRLDEPHDAADFSPDRCSPTAPDVGGQAAGVRHRLASVDEVSALVAVTPPDEVAPSLSSLGLDPSAPGLIIAGNQANLTACEGGEAVSAIPRLARALGWPLLAEPSSGVRAEPAIVAYQQILTRTPELADDARQILVLGHPTLSRPVTALLCDPHRRIVAVDAAGVVTNLGKNVARTSRILPCAQTTASARVKRWADAWHRADAAFVPEDVRERFLSALWRDCATGTRPPVLILGASLGIRALDRAAPALATSPRILANRGLAGIDGTIAFARGVAAGLDEPVRVVVGDVTFAHDIGGLVHGVHERDDDVQVWVLSDGGGRIFSTLEYGRDEGGEMFERYFATPQRLDIALAARAAGWDYLRAHTAKDVERIGAHRVRGRSVIEIDLRASAPETSS